MSDEIKTGPAADPAVQPNVDGEEVVVESDEVTPGETVAPEGDNAEAEEEVVPEDDAEDVVAPDEDE